MHADRTTGSHQHETSHTAKTKSDKTASDKSGSKSVSNADHGTMSTKNQDAGPKQNQASDIGKSNQANDKSSSDKVAKDTSGDDRLSDKPADPREAKLRPNDVVIRNPDGTLYNYVRHGHDVVIPGPNNTEDHLWYGDNGDLYLVQRDYNHGTSIAIEFTPAGPKVIPPKPVVKKDSCAAIYDPVSNTTNIRYWPANGPSFDVGPLPGDQQNLCK